MADWDDFEVEVVQGEYAELRIPLTVTTAGVTSALDLTGTTGHALVARKSPYDTANVFSRAGTVVGLATAGVLSFPVQPADLSDLPDWKHKLYAQINFNDGSGNPLKPRQGRIIVPPAL